MKLWLATFPDQRCPLAMARIGAPTSDRAYRIAIDSVDYPEDASYPVIIKFIGLQEVNEGIVRATVRK